MSRSEKRGHLSYWLCEPNDLANREMISGYVLNPAIVLTRDWLASRPGGEGGTNALTCFARQKLK